ncbi:hypothetical protein PMAYCL1PPCAC_24612, partial [Pristionchus mayeri]
RERVVWRVRRLLVASLLRMKLFRMIFYLQLLGIISIVCYGLFINRIKGLPPGPPPLPLIGNFHLFDTDMDKKFVEWKKKYSCFKSTSS